MHGASLCVLMSVSRSFESLPLTRLQRFPECCAKFLAAVHVSMAFRDSLISNALRENTMAANKERGTEFTPREAAIQNESQRNATNPYSHRPARDRVRLRP